MMKASGLTACAVVSILALTSIGCGGYMQSGGAAGMDNNVITREELVAAQAGDLYQAVERLRPLWLRSRGVRSLTATTEIAIIRDGVYFGPIETLRTIPAEQVSRLEYVDGAMVASLIPGAVGSNRNVESAILVNLGQPPSAPR